MKRSIATQLAILAFGIVGTLALPSNGEAGYYPWGGGCCGSPYTAGYFPDYYGGGFYGVGYGAGYYAGYYPLAFGPTYSTYYGSGCCGGCASPCCSLGCAPCGGCCGASLACSGCYGCGSSCSSCSGCGSSCCGGCGIGLSCAGGCGGAAPGPGCNTGTPSGPAAKKQQPNPDEPPYVPQGSPPYDEPAPRRKKGAPTTQEPGADGFKRRQDGDQGPAAPVKPPGGSPSNDIKTEKPVGPPPTQPQGKRGAPIDLPKDAGATEHGRNHLAALDDVNESDWKKNFTSTTRNEEVGDAAGAARNAGNPALGLQERLTWSYSGSFSGSHSGAHHATTVGRIVSTSAPTPQRIKTPMADWAVLPVEARLVRK